MKRDQDVRNETNRPQKLVGLSRFPIHRTGAPLLGRHWTVDNCRTRSSNAEGSAVPFVP